MNVSSVINVPLCSVSSQKGEKCFVLVFSRACRELETVSGILGEGNRNKRMRML